MGNKIQTWQVLTYDDRQVEICHPYFVKKRVAQRWMIARVVQTNQATRYTLAFTPDQAETDDLLRVSLGVKRVLDFPRPILPQLLEFFDKYPKEQQEEDGGFVRFPNHNNTLVFLSKNDVFVLGKRLRAGIREDRVAVL